MSEVVTARLEESPSPFGGRLGRHVEHDPRSRAFAFEQATTELKTVHHRRYGSVLDQGELGSCTGNAAAGAINTVPLHTRGERLLNEDDAVSIYARATSIDEYPGAWPPDDTGSSGLAVAKVLLERGLITRYEHAFGIEQAIQALQVTPVITGISWYEGFDQPDEHGLVSIAGGVRGGHEIEVKGFTLRRPIETSLVLCENSWGPNWGMRGEFHFTVATWATLLDDQGDVTILVKEA